MEKQNARLLMHHVRVNRNDVNSANANRFQRRLQFIFSDSEVSVDRGVVIASGKGHPVFTPNALFGVGELRSPTLIALIWTVCPFR
jgi:hypothetical protein